ncbi:ABC transporter ATP-binding protein [Aliidiomarina soli]|uniref:Methionine ABC transporter ATP-binding protein n=1 Tax=Aliidiomarina soli TaxID=1928574 RepID=A0A432WDQ5_9GAMM|nr:ABC transporter ATP-binding protein [Aliidiomarina soli]RUO31013.1 methionine ABC transporter ATP-binding protein [Aliidiomarina soli]
MNSIVVNGLRFHYPAQAEPTLDIGQLEIARGERVFLYGPSGSGKSTLLSVLAGIHRPQSGTVAIEDIDITALTARQRDHFRAHHIGYIFQQFNLLPYLDCIHNVALACEFSKVRRQRLQQRNISPEDEAARLLNQLGISHEMHSRRASELSVGQQQRVAAARALIGSPELIIADEPTSALDADSRLSFLKLLFAECERAGSTLLFVSHDAELAGQFDRSLSLSALNQSAEA